MCKHMATRLNTVVLDLGTTTIKAALCNNSSQIQTVLSLPAPAIKMDQGHCVSDAMEYLSIAKQLLTKCLHHCQARPSLGICYQRSSFLIWDSHSGRPVTRLISWQDTTGQSSCTELMPYNSLIKQLSGLPLTPYYFAPKLRTLLQKQAVLAAGIVNGNLRVGTLDSFIIWHWTDGAHFLTDASMAARTLLLDIHTGQWSKTLTDIFAIPLPVLPKIQASTQFNLTLTNGAILKVSLADQSAALLANVTCSDPVHAGAAKNEILINLGTGGFVVRTEPKPARHKVNHYLRTLVYQDPQKKHVIAIEGSLNSITMALQAYPFHSCQIADLATIPDLFCIAEPTGIGAPFFRPEFGLQFSRPTDHLSKSQIASLILEAIIFRVALILEDFIQQPDNTQVYLSGGLANLSCLQQGIAICSPAPVFTCLQKHASLQGTAILVNNLAPATYRQSAAIIATRHPLLLAKYQQWKCWFNNLMKS